VISADPDGYTLLVSIAGSLTIAPTLYKLEYDPLKDLAPIAIVEQSPQILTVNPVSSAARRRRGPYILRSNRRIRPRAI
jgi:tripartite-type tricarboxylate transporter receptor subunit TctC